MSRQRSESRPPGSSTSSWGEEDTTTMAGRIGRGIRIKGMVRGKEDLMVEGEVEGSITLPEHHVVLERPSRTSADVRAHIATLRGRHRGNATASDKIEITAEGCVIGDLRSPRLVMHEGAKFRGKIEMDVDLPADLTTGTESGTDHRSHEARRDHNSKKKSRQAD